MNFTNRHSVQHRELNEAWPCRIEFVYRSYTLLPRRPPPALAWARKGPAAHRRMPSTHAALPNPIDQRANPLSWGCVLLSPHGPLGMSRAGMRHVPMYLVA